MNDTAEKPNASPVAARAMALAEQAPFPSWLAGNRAKALRGMTQAHFPGRKSESWKYTRLHALETSGVLDQVAPVSDARVPAAAAPGLDAWRIVFVNGRYDAAQSRLPDDGSLTVLPLVQVPAGEQQSAQELLVLADDGRLPFGMLNAAAFTDGIYVRAGKGNSPGKPLHVVFHAAGNRPATAQARLLVRVDAQAELALVEQYTGDGDAQYTNAVTSIDLGRAARLDWVRVQLEDPRQYFTGSAHLRQQADSRCRGWLLSTGGKLKRNDIVCTLAAPGAELALRGVFLAGAGEHVDNQVCIEHAAPHGTSTQVFKGLVGGDGRAVFNGRIHIHPGAKQTNAELTNNNLLLSPDAEVDTKPELEIYNDDVKCAHGATVGQMNEMAVFYLQSRGIARADAELMLALGFVNELVDDVPLAPLAAWLRDGFARWFAARSGRRTGGARP